MKTFDYENECKIEPMNFLEKIEIKYYGNSQKTQPQEEEKNAIQSSFTKTTVTYKKCNETISSETPSKNNYLQEIPDTTCFKIKNTENQIGFDRSEETSSPPITKPIPEAIYEFKPKKPNLELSNNSKMLIALFGEREFIETSGKYRTQLKENKKHDNNAIASHKKVAPEIEAKLKIRETELLKKANDTEIKEIFEGESLAGEKIGKMKDLK